MNRHSRILGNDPDRTDTQRPRGQRAYCSDRGRRSGCGRTVALYFAAVLPRHSVTSSLLARLLVSLLAGVALNAAVEALHTLFAVETFYRLRQRLRRRLDRVRVLLHREQSAPVGVQSDPLLQSVEHLQQLFQPASDAVAAFQLRFQRALLG